MGNFKEDVGRIKAFVFDVDGVFTDGGIIPLPDGDFLRKYYAKDGFAVSSAIKAGYKVCIITGGRGKTLEMRFAMLGVTRFYSNVSEKLPVLKEFMEEFALSPDEVMFMGDDLPDYDSMKHVGMPVCPNDAAVEIVRISRYVSQFPGGGGCVRDMIEQVMRANEQWGEDRRCATTVPSA